MGRGRPKGSKNKKTLERERIAHLAEAQKQPEKPVIFEDATKDIEPTNIIIPEEKHIVKTTIKPPKISGTCDKCHADIYCSPVSINLSYLLSQATWHRDCKIERVCLCNKCAAELNSMIDNWLLKDNPQYYKWNV